MRCTLIQREYIVVLVKLFPKMCTNKKKTPPPTHRHTHLSALNCVTVHKHSRTNRTPKNTTNRPTTCLLASTVDLKMNADCTAIILTLAVGCTAPFDTNAHHQTLKRFTHTHTHIENTHWTHKGVIWKFILLLHLDTHKKKRTTTPHTHTRKQNVLVARNLLTTLSCTHTCIENKQSSLMHLNLPPHRSRASLRLCVCVFDCV